MKDKERYAEEVKTLGKRERQSRKPKEGDAKRAKKDKDAPKKPMTAYFIWLSENRQALADKFGLHGKVAQLTKKAAQEWKTMDESAKVPYNNKAVAARQKYQDDLEAYKARQPAADAAEEVEEEDE